MTQKKYIYAASFYAYTIQGAVTVSLGLLLPHMMNTYSMDYTQGGAMIFFQLLGGVISSLYGGILVNKLGQKALTILGGLCIITGYTLMIFANSIAFIYALLYLVGTGTGIFNIALNSLVAYVSKSDSKKINTLHIFYAVGAVFITLLMAAVTHYNLSWRLYLYTAAGMTVLCILMFSRIKVENNESEKGSRENDFSFFKSIYIYLFVALAFLYVGIEIAINGWVVTFLNDSSIVSGTASNYILTVLWTIVIAGRLINQRLKGKVTLETRIAACAIIIFISYLIFINTSAIWVLIASVVVLGVAMSAFYPNVIANSTKTIEDNPTALGLIMSFGGLGGAIIPWVSGVVADSRGLKSSMISVAMFVGVLILAALANFLLKNRVRKKSATQLTE